ncbi:hypothetical protein AK812_SmicGene3021 [Symbiodinium microadriaticum]|uniref:Uncharacterized protein n=1 Tax=Symbiodinium microadriaticum TaxID=2951 RepID=A0A1Q9F065_SYMMI|nr:hypothetical protein AK812_SmicGene3021 [Symbiodinium microadriaticum]
MHAGAQHEDVPSDEEGAGKKKCRVMLLQYHEAYLWYRRPAIEAVLAYWTLLKFKARLDQMRDCFDELQKQGKWEGSGDCLRDPWMETSIEELRQRLVAHIDVESKRRQRLVAHIDVESKRRSASKTVAPLSPRGRNQTGSQTLVAPALPIPATVRFGSKTSLISAESLSGGSGPASAEGSKTLPAATASVRPKAGTLGRRMVPKGIEAMAPVPSNAPSTSSSLKLKTQDDPVPTAEKPISPPGKVPGEGAPGSSAVVKQKASSPRDTRSADGNKLKDAEMVRKCLPARIDALLPQELALCFEHELWQMVHQVASATGTATLDETGRSELQGQFSAELGELLAAALPRCVLEAWESVMMCKTQITDLYMDNDELSARRQEELLEEADLASVSTFLLAFVGVDGMIIIRVIMIIIISSIITVIIIIIIIIIQALGQRRLEDRDTRSERKDASKCQSPEAAFEFHELFRPLPAARRIQRAWKRYQERSSPEPVSPLGLGRTPKCLGPGRTVRDSRSCGRTSWRWSRCERVSCFLPGATARTPGALSIHLLRQGAELLVQLPEMPPMDAVTQFQRNCMALDSAIVPVSGAGAVAFWLNVRNLVVVLALRAFDAQVSTTHALQTK